MTSFDTLGNLISLCHRKKKKVILFLGARASIESGNEEIDAMINRVIQEHGFDLAQTGDANRYETFYEVLNDMPQDLRHLVFSELFEKMEPTEGYVFLADLVKRGYFDVIITTNFDNLLETSFTEQQLAPGRHHSVYIVGSDKETELRHFLQKPTPHTKVLKLYGDLGRGVVLFTPEETLRLPEETEKNLRRISEETMLFVGYGERDRNVIQVLSPEGESVWWAAPPELSWENRDDRPVLQFLLNRKSDGNVLCGEAAQFDGFFRSLHQCLTGEELPEREIVGSWNYAKVQIFLGYAREDKEKVENLYQKLSDAGFKPWMDKRDILPGENWKFSIQQAIRRADFFLVCLSARSVSKRGFLQKEIRTALDIWQEKLRSDIYLIPVRLEDCEVFESLREFQWVNLFEKNGWTRLVKAIQVGMERRAEVVIPVHLQEDTLEAATETLSEPVARLTDRSVLGQLEKELRQNQELLEAVEKRGHELKLKRAKYGFAFPAGEAVELREAEEEAHQLRKEILRLEAQIRGERKRSSGDLHP